MLGRANRFHGYGSLRYVYQHGQNVRGTVMGVRISRNDRRKQYRLAVVVSKKVHKSAVVRNRIRRRIFEIARHHATEFETNLDVVITVFSSSVATMPAAELEENFVQLMERAKLIKPTESEARHDIIETKET